MRKQIEALRALMRQNGIDNYIVTTTDAHNSEYVSSHDMVLQYLSGFTGSNGTLLVTETEALLWTDGRYYIQCERELEGSGISMMRQGDERDPSVEKYLADHLKPGDTLGFNGYNITKHQSDTYLSKCPYDVKIRSINDPAPCVPDPSQANTVYIVIDSDPAGMIWDSDTDDPRPARPHDPIREHDIRFAGASVADKLKQVREAMGDKVSAHILSSLPDIMWLYNIRGRDILYNPVALSYSYITHDKAYLFVQQGTVDGSLEKKLSESGVIICDYDGFTDFLRKQPVSSAILLDEREISVMIYDAAAKRAQIVNKSNPTALLKAVKNETEIRSMKDYFLTDSCAMTAYLYAVKKIMGCNIPDEMEKLFAGDTKLAGLIRRYSDTASDTDKAADTTKTSATAQSSAENISAPAFDELKAGRLCDEIRLAADGCFDLSFTTIAAYGPNAAMMHYEAREDSYAPIESRGMLLTDCGGQYPGATTDVTRTIAVGPVTEEEKRCFTLVLKGWLALMHATWIEGCTGRNLDILARQYLWSEGIDYKCGTGHGVGNCLSVHEGPQNIRWRYIEGSSEAVLRPGMVVTNEPGVYIEGRFGIRTENTMLVTEKFIRDGDRYLGFENLTMVPIDTDLVDPALLDDRERAWLSEYNDKAYDLLSQYI